MAQTILITLTAGGTDTGPFDLYSDADGYVTPFANDIAKATLEAGYISAVVPDGATIIRIQSDNSICENFTDVVISTTTTTSTSTSSTTTTSTSSTTTTTSTSSTTTTTTTIAFETFNLRFEDVEEDVCFASPINVYAASGATLTPGTILYLDTALTTPITGTNFAWDGVLGSDLYTMNPGTGAIVGIIPPACF